MVKKQKKIAEPKVETQSYSTRFDEKQRSIIEEAARISGNAPAKLIREASLEKAAAIINVEGDSRRELTALARRIVKQLRSPNVMLQLHHMGDPSEDTFTEIRSAPLGEYFDREMDERGLEVYSHEIEPLTNRILAQFKTALETAGTEFTKILVEQWFSAGDEINYSAKIDPKELLKGDTGEKE